MRAAFVIGAVILATAAFGATATADTIRFSIAPASANGGAFFSYSLVPGVTVNDTAVVQNSSQAPIALHLYAADAVTATNGGTAFMAFGQFRDHTHTWIEARSNSITIPAYGSLAIPFRVNVPKDALPGDHIAGLVVESVPQAGAGAGFGATIVQRAGVAVAVRVPGAAKAALALGEVCLNQQNGSNYLQLVAANQGDVLTKASGDLVFKTDTGREVFQRSVDIGTVLPHDSAFVRVDAPSDPGPGRFVASFRLALSDGGAAALDAPLTVGEAKVNGCVKADAAPAPQAPQRLTSQVAPLASTRPSSSDPLGGAVPAMLAGGAGLLLGAAAVWVLRKR